MSVIFETLKKLNTESAEKKSGKSKLMRRKRIYFINNSLYSTSAVLLGLLITVIGSGTLYGYYHFRETKGGNTEVFTVQKTDIAQPAAMDSYDSSEINGSRNLNQEKDPRMDRIEYLPSQVNDTSIEMYATNKTEKNKLSSVNYKKRTLKTSETIEKNMADKIKANRSNIPETEEVSPVPQMKKIFFEHAKKNGKIARLIADIHWEMENGADERTEKLFDELVTLKGRDNSYVLKLKAVWYMHNNEFEKAEDLLKKVLSKNEHDQEAEINMAIIEIKTQHLQKAYERLKNLRELYPENIRVTEIIQNMKPLLNKTQTRHLIRDDKP